MEKKISNQKEKHREVVHGYDERISTLKEELKTLDREFVLLKKTNQYLEKKVAKKESNINGEDALKAEMKKIINQSIELTNDIMSFAKGEKNMIPLIKNCKQI